MSGSGDEYALGGGAAAAVPQQEEQEKAQKYRLQPPHLQRQQQHRNAVAPRHPDEQRMPLNTNRSSTRPPSSVCSQLSPVNTAFSTQQQHQPPYHQQYQQDCSQAYEADNRLGYLQNVHYQSHPRRRVSSYARNTDVVSPPSSPEVLPREYLPDDPSTPPNISPIDDSPDPYEMPRTAMATGGAQEPRPASSTRSNIPMMRRERRQNQDAATRALRETKSKEQLSLSQRGYKGGDVRWDPSTGELTNSNKSRPSQVKPAELVRGLSTSPEGSASPSNREPQREVPTGIASFASRLRRTVHGHAGKAEPAAPAPATVVSRPVAPPRDLSSSTDPAVGAFVSDRPAWQGASGRTTLVAPVHDTKDVRPLGIPRRSKRVGSVTKLNADMDISSPSSPNSPGHNTSTFIQQLASPPASPTPGGESPGREPVRKDVHTLYQSPPMPSSPAPQDNSRGNANQPVSSHPDTSPLQNRRVSAVKRKPAPPNTYPYGSYHEQDPFNCNNTQPLPSLQEPAHDPEWTQSPSRFSVTTYNSTAHGSNLALGDAPEMPPVPDRIRATPPHSRPTPISVKPLPNPEATGEGVMDRRRPLCMGHASPRSIKDGAEPVVISLKTPWKSSDRTTAQDKIESGGDDNTKDLFTALLRKKPVTSSIASSSVDPCSSMAGSVHKTLPPAPPETVAKDRVTMLNAQLADLAQRRFNIDRSIKQMTELMPTDNLLASADVIRTREEEKRKVEGLRLELAEIQREEYEIGLKLHRAYKRLNDNAEYEPTTLWVRRVTG